MEVKSAYVIEARSQAVRLSLEVGVQLTAGEQVEVQRAVSELGQSLQRLLLRRSIRDGGDSE